MKTIGRVPAAAIAALVLSGAPMVSAQKNDKSAKDGEAKRPHLTLRARPAVAVAPARVVLTAELQGGDDDFEEYYCPTIEWEWGDDTSSESTLDCEPYESGKSEIKRRFTVEHTFRRPGAYKVYFHLKRKEKPIGSASVSIQVQPGALLTP
jgi:hypothetical protein